MCTSEPALVGPAQARGRELIFFAGAAGRGRELIFFAGPAGRGRELIFFRGGRWAGPRIPGASLVTGASLACKATSGRRGARQV